MIFKNPRKIQFQYAAQNSNKEPLSLTFEFPEDTHYMDNLKMFAQLLDQAKADVQAEIDLASSYVDNSGMSRMLPA
jgi:hypothetical protein